MSRRIESVVQTRMRPTRLRWALRQQIPFGGAYLCGLLRLRNNRLRPHCYVGQKGFDG